MTRKKPYSVFYCELVEEGITNYFVYKTNDVELFKKLRKFLPTVGNNIITVLPIDHNFYLFILCLICNLLKEIEIRYMDGFMKIVQLSFNTG